MKNTLGTLFLALALAPLAQAAAPQVTVTSFQQVGRRVEITYDLDADGIVTADIVTNDVSIGAQLLTGMYGDVNKAIAAGTGKKIYWSPEASVNTTFHNAYAKLTAWALDAPPNYCVLDLTTKSNITYYVSAEAIPFGVADNIYKTERMVFRKVPAKGVQFRMGTPGNTSAEIPHRVTFTNDYYLGIYETTKKQANLIWSRDWNNTPEDDPDYWIKPVDNVPMTVFRGSRTHSPASQGGTLPETTGANGYLRRLADKTGAELDLPLEAQWEYACRAGSAEAYYWGSDSADDLGDYAWYAANCTNALTNTAETHPVGLKKPNAWGFYDMYGNVGERCNDYYYTGSNYSDGSDVIEPYGYIKGDETESTQRVVRGGGQGSSATNCRSAVRGQYWPGEPGTVQYCGYGYRIWMRPQAYVK